MVTPKWRHVVKPRVEARFEKNGSEIRPLKKSNGGIRYSMNFVEYPKTTIARPTFQLVLVGSSSFSFQFILIPDS